MYRGNHEIPSSALSDQEKEYPIFNQKSVENAFVQSNWLLKNDYATRNKIGLHKQTPIHHAASKFTRRRCNQLIIQHLSCSIGGTYRCNDDHIHKCNIVSINWKNGT